MAHDIKSNKNHAIINLKIALNETDGDRIADGLNELLNEQLDHGFIADYAILNSDQPAIIKAFDDNKEGELFNRMNNFTVCITNKEGQCGWAKIETELNLDRMDQDALRNALADFIYIQEGETVLVCNAAKTMRFFIPA